jgi:Arc/MetJ family transcription regulator
MRTNIEIDDELMQKAMAASDATTKKGVVEEALRLMVDIKGQGAIDELWGAVPWRGHDDEWFSPDPLDPESSATIASQPNPNPNASDEELVAAAGLAREHGHR